MSARLMIRALQQTNSTNDKMTILRKCDSPVVQEVLHMAYNPYIRYGLNKVPWTGKGSLTIEGHWPAIKVHLEYMAQAHGDNVVKELTAKLILSMTREDGDVLKGIIKKDLKCGVSVTTINRVFPELVPVFGIMKAETFADKLWQPDLMGSVKLDGYRCLVRDGKLYSSGGLPILGAEHIQSAIHGFGDFDGEIMIPNMEFNMSGGKIRSHSVTPDAKLFVFDCINAPNLPFNARYYQLLNIGEEQGWSTSLAKPSTITVVRHRTFTNLVEMKQICGKALYAGYEGLVLKDPNGVYERKRSKAWLKVKQVLDEDCPIIGFFEGEGKYENMLGGVIVRRKNGYESKVGGGFSDTLRSYIWNHQREFLGKHIEIHYQEDTPDGDFRQARFKKFRPDKD